MLKNITITVPEEVAHWARMRAAEEHTSVSRLVGKLLETQMMQSDDYRKAWDRWRQLAPLDIDAAHRLTRDEAHERR